MHLFEEVRAARNAAVLTLAVLHVVPLILNDWFSTSPSLLLLEAKV